MYHRFGVAVPLYFIMSVNRGNLQGRSAFIELSVTYQLEMIFRLAGTFAFLMFFNISSSIAVSSAIAISFVAGVFPFKKISTKKAIHSVLTAKENKAVLQFFILTACYEGTQIICNNSDILLVKHYFPSYDAGLYASLALMMVVLHIFAAILINGGSWRDVTILAVAPFYILWKLIMLPQILRNASTNASWERTDREIK